MSEPIVLPRQSSSPRSPSVKFLYTCGVPTKDWLWIDHVLHKSNADLGLLKGRLLNKRSKHVVVKFGIPTVMRHEYDIGELLKAIPNFMRYYCNNFTCDDTATHLFQQNYVTHPHICKGPGDNIGFAIMPYYSLGSMNSHSWKIDNLDILKNVLKQVAGGILTAHALFGFSHNDIHLDNILLRRTSKKHLTYPIIDSDLMLPLKGTYAIIMDFERSTIKPAHDSVPRRAYEAVRKVLHLAATMDANSDLALDVNDLRIMRLASTNTPVTASTVQEVWTAIDGMTVRYQKSQVPQFHAVT